MAAHKNVFLCPVTAIAWHLLQRYYGDKKLLPNVLRSREWFKEYLFSEQKEMSWEQHAKNFESAQDKACLSTSHPTHVFRSSAAQHLQANG